MKLFLVFMLGALLAGCAQGTRETRVLTVQELRQNLDAYDGKRVRVRGEFDQCRGWHCFLCPENERDEYSCIRVRSTPIKNMAPDEENLRDYYQASKHLFQEMYRFATVTISAELDADCLRPDVICTHPPAPLYDARVEKVHGRKSMLDGFVSYPIGTIVPAGEDVVAALKADDPNLEEGDDWFGAYHFFSVKRLEENRGGRALAVACLCKLDECEGKWPMKWDTDTASPANPFICHQYEKRGARWIRSMLREE